MHWSCVTEAGGDNRLGRVLTRCPVFCLGAYTSRDMRALFIRRDAFQSPPAHISPRVSDHRAPEPAAPPSAPTSSSPCYSSLFRSSSLALSCLLALSRLLVLPLSSSLLQTCFRSTTAALASHFAIISRFDILSIFYLHIDG